METVISSRNFFIDTSADTGDGDNATIHLSGHNITAGDGQLIKLSLLNFDMYRNWYGVNTNNSKVKLVTVIAGVASTDDVIIPNKNYSKLGEIVEAFAAEVRTTILAFAQAQGTTSAQTATVIEVLPDANEAIDSTGDRLMSFSIDFGATHGIDSFSLQCLPDEGDSYRILGGDRIQGLSLIHI